MKGNKMGKLDVRFGTGGNPDKFYETGGKSSLEMPSWLNKLGLDAYEYECCRGVKIADRAASIMKAEAEKYNIALSVHAPYYINIASDEEERQDKSVKYILQTAEAAKKIGADRIVVHMGSPKALTRAKGIELSKNLIIRVLSEMRELRLDDVHICLETMGKVSQLGSVEEVAEVCSVDDSLLPAIDFGHINARTQGMLRTAADYEKIVKILEKKLGWYRTESMHVHFSRIEYTHMGEKKHLTFEDSLYGPYFEHFAEVIAKKWLQPRIICESAGTQDRDALIMKKIWEDSVTDI